MRKNTLFMLGNTHFDPVWLWTWDEAMASIRSTFRSALDRMEENDDFVFSFCTPPVFEWIKKVDPAMFAQIKARVHEGRWDLAEGFWVQPDCNAPHGESFVRHGLYTQRYLQEAFGKRATTVFNIDSFGHNANLPQILTKCGLKYYVFSRPAPSDKALPDSLFIWKSPDGSAVMALRCGHYGGGMYSKDIKADITAHDGVMPGLSHDYALIYGVSNHGGAPTRQCISDINEMSAVEGRPYDIRYGSTTGFFEANESARLPEVQDELQVSFFGPYSNDARIKSDNRAAEYAAMRAEKAAVFAWVSANSAYPREAIRNGWKDILFNQFHDILGGACIKNAYRDARNLHGRALQSLDEITHMSLQAIAKDIEMPGCRVEGADWNIVVFNLNGMDITDTFEAEVQWAWELDWYEGDLALLDSAGHSYPLQIVRELSVIPAFRSRVAFHATIPAHGYKAFALVKKHRPKAQSEMPCPAFEIENGRYKLMINPQTGNVSSIYSKRHGKAVMSDAFAMNVRQDDGDTWAFNVKGYGEALAPIALVDSRVIEYGQVFTTLKTTSQFGNSKIEQYFTIYEHSDAVDYRYRVNWNEQHKVLKLTFALPEGCGEQTLTAAIPYGCIRRAADGVEYPVGEWLDVSYCGGGYSLLMRNTFAYDAAQAVSLTILRSPVYGDLRMDRPLDDTADYDYLNQGITEGCVRWLPHDGDYAGKRVPELASAYNNPPVMVIEANHPGTLPGEKRYVTLDASTTMLSVIKQAEDGDDMILRLAEYGGKQDRAILYMDGKSIGAVNMGAYEIKTIRLKRAPLEVRQVNMLEE